jgi:hypothetical protein
MQPVDPHIFALLRIVFGLLGLAGLLGVTDFVAYWDLSGLVSPADAKAHRLASHLGMGDAAGRWLFWGCVAAYGAMTLGIASRVALVAAFLAAIAQTAWNPLPLSGAYQAHRVLLFCLIWADCGAVWSVDAWLRPSRQPVLQPIWPLRLFRLQVAVIYGASGVWKLQDVHWRDGSALHYVMSNVQFRRAPMDPPPWSAEMLTALTYITLFWELLFPVLILHRATRRVALIVGVMLHAGMWMTLELGPFAPVMIGSYLAFLNPADVPRLGARFRESGRRLRRWIPFASSAGA